MNSNFLLSNEQIKNLPEIETNRLLLRPMTASDADIIVKWRNSLHVMKFSQSQEKITRERHLVWFKNTRNSRLDYIVLTKADLNPIGSFSYKQFPAAKFQCCAEVGKYIGEKQALGKGYAKEANTSWIRFGFKHLKLDAIIERTRLDNEINLHISKQLGFVVTSIESDVESSLEWVWMILTKESWLNKNPD